MIYQLTFTYDLDFAPKEATIYNLEANEPPQIGTIIQIPPSFPPEWRDSFIIYAINHKEQSAIAGMRIIRLPGSLLTVDLANKFTKCLRCEAIYLWDAASLKVEDDEFLDAPTILNGIRELSQEHINCEPYLCPN